jgi:hypothetical protein
MERQLQKKDYRDLAILQALYAYKQASKRGGNQATYNKLYETTCQWFAKMPRQTFQNRLAKLIKEGYVKSYEQKESKLMFKPVIYEITPKGELVAHPSWATFYTNQLFGILDKASNTPLIEIFETFRVKLMLASAVVFLLLIAGEGDFVESAVADRFYAYTYALEKRLKEHPSEALELLPFAIGLSYVNNKLALMDPPLPQSLLDDLKEKIIKLGGDPEAIINEGLKKGEELWEKFGFKRANQAENKS